MTHLNEKVSKTTRRTLLQTTVGALGALSLLGLSARRAKAEKVSKAAVAYQGSPKGSQRCDDCALWEGLNSCKQVEGAISPSGWCRIWTKAS
ncbi:MAG: high-potential iron-sulfur protein [Methylocella sp.]|jgi:hypothetical protein